MEIREYPGEGVQASTYGFYQESCAGLPNGLAGAYHTTSRLGLPLLK